ncbi:MAG: YlbF family regulator [Kyrpidia sp.]|nr:YlbF family regulator [Kyrpidia sp.]
MNPGVRAEVHRRAHALARMIAGSEEVARYRQCKVKIEQNREVQELLKSQKRLRMSVSVLKMRGASREKLEAAERALGEVERRLAAIPVVGQYRAAQDELNLLFQGIARIIAQTVSSRVPVELDSGGCSGGCGGCGGCPAR